MTDILVVDDDHGMRDFLEILLTQEGYSVTCASDGKKALSLCEKNTFDLAITDLKMPKFDGIDFLRGIKDVSPDTSVILITAYASAETAVSAMREGAYDYLEKNFNVDDLKKIIQDALQKKAAKKRDTLFIQGIKDSDRFGSLIGKSKKILKVYSLINRVAETSANVLVLGESGTGKELVAKSIHENSPRNGKPFVVINCGAIPENLLESELFGYMKGAFTGAYSDNPGLFEIADKGTIFLDEIGELPMLLQVKLLRVIQERIVRRVGGSEDIKIDVRIIAATNQDLEKKVKARAFREDLYYRLNVILIELPPLRERKEDIPVLANYFISKYSKKFGRERNNISSYAIELLKEYRFPGNIRELENIIEKNIALGTSNIILPENLIYSENNGNGADYLSDIDLPEDGLDLNEAIAKIERNIIKKVMIKTNGSKSKTAEYLKLSPDSLRYRIEKLGI